MLGDEECSRSGDMERDGESEGETQAADKEGECDKVSFFCVTYYCSL